MSARVIVLALIVVAVLLGAAAFFVVGPQGPRGRALVTANTDDRTRAEQPVVVKGSHEDPRAPEIAVPEDAWRRFCATCESKDWAAAKSALPGVLPLPLATRLQILSVLTRIKLVDDDADAFRPILLMLLAPPDESQARDVGAACMATFEACWPSLEKLSAERKDNFDGKVDCMPLSTPERDAFLPMDGLVLDVCFHASQLRAPLEAARELFDRGKAKPWTDRAYLEPALSGFVGLLSKEKIAAFKTFAGEYSECSNLTPRLRWELRLLSGSDALLKLVAQLDESVVNLPDVLRGALKSGVTVDELLKVLLPYLDTRFGTVKACNAIKTAFFADITKMTPEVRAQFGSAVARGFMAVDSGSGIADICLALLTSTMVFRDLKETPKGSRLAAEPDFSGITRLVEPQDRGAMREKLKAHWKASVSVAREHEFLPSDACALCEAAIEASDSLAEAVEFIEETWAACPTKTEKERVRFGFSGVLLRCRGLFASEMTSDYNLRRRLIAVVEQILDVPVEYYSGNTAETIAEQQVVLADQVLAICAVEQAIQLSVHSGRVVRDIINQFQKYCIDQETNPPVIKRSSKSYEDTYKRVTTRFGDDRLVSPSSR